jgi:hypothetical protein
MKPQKIHFFRSDPGLIVKKQEYKQIISYCEKRAPHASLPCSSYCVQVTCQERKDPRFTTPDFRTRTQLILFTSTSAGASPFFPSSRITYRHHHLLIYTKFRKIHENYRFLQLSPEIVVTVPVPGMMPDGSHLPPEGAALP